MSDTQNKSSKHTIELHLHILEKSCRDSSLSIFNKDEYSLIKDDKEKIKYLISNGADLDLKLDDGWTLLRTVSRYSREYGDDLVKFILEHGANPNIQGQNGRTPLHSASRNSNKDSTEGTIKLLLEHGANPNIQEDEGWTPLHMASRYSNTDRTEGTVKLLLEDGANPYVIINVNTYNNAFDLITNKEIRKRMETYYRCLLHKQIYDRSILVKKINKMEKMLEFMINGQPGGQIEQDLKVEFESLKTE